MVPDPSHAPSGSSPMSKLSIEILLRITFWLKTPDLCNMRLTCHSIERCIYDSFVEEFIARKQFMITPFSLQALVSLTESPIGAHLRRLQLGTDLLTPGGLWHHLEAHREGRRLILEQEMCTRDGSHRRLLAQAFKNIKRHRGEDFEIVVRDFNSRRRTRDASRNRFAEWTSYGRATAEDHGVRVMRSNQNTQDTWETPCSVAAIFRDVVISLADAGVQPSGIEVMARYGDFMSERTFYMNPLETGLPMVLSGLKKLHLTLGLRPNSPLLLHGGHGSHGEMPLEKAEEETIMAFETLPVFFSHCESLRELRINHVAHVNVYVEAFLVWLSKRDSAIYTGLPPPIHLDLETISLGTTHTRPKTLLNILIKFLPTLRSIEIWRVALCVPFPATSIADTPEPNVWRDFLIKLADQVQDSKLEKIMIGNIAESYRSGDHVRIDGCVSRHVAFAGRHMHEYRGPDVGNALREMSRSINWQESLEKFKKRISWQSETEAASSNDEDEDMDEDMNDDEGDGDDDDEDDNDHGNQ